MSLHTIYQSLGLHLKSTERDIIRATWLALNDEYRHQRKHRHYRRGIYKMMIEEHKIAIERFLTVVNPAGNC